MERAGRKPAGTGKTSDGIAVSRIAFGGCPNLGGIPRRLRPATEARCAGDRIPVQAIGTAESQEGGKETDCEDTRTLRAGEARSGGGPTPEAARDGEGKVGIGERCRK